MHSHKLLMLGLNVVLGSAVLGSYVWGLKTWPDHADALWGGVPKSWRPAYTANMFLAAAGYLLLLSYLLRNFNVGESTVLGGAGLMTVNLLFVGILVCSILWMPLTLYAIDGGRQALVPVIYLVLAGCALSSLGMTAALATMTPAPMPAWHTAALVGMGFFCLQTVVLDGVIWSWKFGI